jgi:TusA-related sulfurtransferase
MTTQDLNSIEAASVVDARGSACPGPLLEAKKGIGKVKVGEVLEILSNDSATKSDIPIWANKVGHEFLGHLEADVCARNKWMATWQSREMSKRY